MKVIYLACCTQTYRGALTLEADSPEEARRLAQQELEKMNFPKEIEGFDLGKSCVDCVVIKKTVED